MPRGIRGIFRVGTKTRWRIQHTENELIAYFSFLVTTPAPIEMIACEAYGCVSIKPTTDQVSD